MAKTERNARILAGLLLVPSLALVGVVIGMSVATLTTRGVGWDTLANALGGAMIGVVAGPIVALYLARRLDAAPLRATTVASVSIALVILGFVAFRFIQRQADAVPEPHPPGAVTAPADSESDTGTSRDVK